MKLKLVLADYLLLGFTALYAFSSLSAGQYILLIRFALFSTTYYFAIRFGTAKSIRCAEDVIAGYAMAATFIGAFAIGRGAGVGEWVTRLRMGEGDTITLARVLAIGAYMIVYFMFLKRQSFLGLKTPKFVNYAAFLICSYGLVASQTRSVVLGFVVAVAFTFFVMAIWSERKATFVFSFIIVFGTLMAGLFYYLAQHPETWDRLYRTTVATTRGNDRSVNSRFDSWGKAIELFQRKPIFGYGVGGFDLRTGMGYPHNVVLEALCELGIGGGLLLVSFFIAVFRKIKFVQQPLYLACYSAMILSCISMQLSGNLTMQRHFFISAALVVTLTQAINNGRLTGHLR